MSDLASKSCAACEGWAPPLTEDQIAAHVAQIDPAWKVDLNQQTLSRRFVFKGYARAVYLANLVAFISDREGHHADVSFGWGYCVVTYTSHELGRLSDNDFVCAAKLDAAIG